MTCPQRPRDAFGRLRTRPRDAHAEDTALLDALRRFDAGEDFAAIAAAVGDGCTPDGARDAIVGVLLDDAAQERLH